MELVSADVGMVTSGSLMNRATTELGVSGSEMVRCMFDTGDCVEEKSNYSHKPAKLAEEKTEMFSHGFTQIKDR